MSRPNNVRILLVLEERGEERRDWLLCLSSSSRSRAAAGDGWRGLRASELVRPQYSKKTCPVRRRGRGHTKAATGEGRKKRRRRRRRRSLSLGACSFFSAPSPKKIKFSWMQQANFIDSVTYMYLSDAILYFNDPLICLGDLKIIKKLGHPSRRIPLLPLHTRVPRLYYDFAIEDFGAKVF